MAHAGPPEDTGHKNGKDTRRKDQIARERPPKKRKYHTTDDDEAGIESDTEDVDVRGPNEKFLKERGIDWLHHFTDSSNLDSIQKHGLRSQKYHQQNKINVKYASSEWSRQRDKDNGYQNCVRLSVVRDHPMGFVAKDEGRINDRIVLQISLAAADLPGVSFSDRNALRSGAQIESAPGHLHYDVFNQNYFRVTPKEQKYYQAEVLVPDCVPAEMLKFND